MATKHKVIRFDCDQCVYQGTDEDKLGVHKKKAHEAMVHACDQCHFNSSTLGELNEHVDTKHTPQKNILYQHCESCIKMRPNLIGWSSYPQC